MELLQSVSDNMLNIEGSLRSEMKARLMTGKDINAQAVREAAMIAQTTGDYSKLSEELSKQVGSAEEFGKMGPMQQKAYADAFGMTTEQMTEMLTKQEQINKYGESGAKWMDMTTTALGTAATGAKEFGVQHGAAVLQAGIMNKLAGKGFGFSLKNLKPGGGAPAPEAPKMDAKSGEGMGGMTKAIQGIDAKKLLAGGAALVLVAASVFVFAKAVQ